MNQMDKMSPRSVSLFHQQVALVPVGWKDVENIPLLVIVGCVPKIQSRLKGFTDAVDKIIGTLSEVKRERSSHPLYELGYRIFYQLAQNQNEKGKALLPETIALLPFFEKAIDIVVEAINERSVHSLRQVDGHSKGKDEAYRLAGCVALAWAFHKYGIPSSSS